MEKIEKMEKLIKNILLKAIEKGDTISLLIQNLFGFIILVKDFILVYMNY